MKENEEKREKAKKKGRNREENGKIEEKQQNNADK